MLDEAQPEGKTVTPQNPQVPKRSQIYTSSRAQYSVPYST